MSISADGTRVAIGSLQNDNDNGGTSGHTRVFELKDGYWVKLGSNIDGDVPFDRFGWSVSLSADGTRVAIGSPQGDIDNGDTSGYTRVFELKDGEWVKLGSNIDGESSGDFSGISVSISADGTRVAIGSTQGDNDNGDTSGHTRVFELKDGDWAKIGSNKKKKPQN